jgi:hypothetical protein
MVYVAKSSRLVTIFDNVMFLVVVIFVSLLFRAGIAYLSFTTGLLVGMTIIQIYFHRFSEPST